MTLRLPLSAQSEVVNERRRWNQDWYTWLSDLTSGINAGQGVPFSIFPATPGSDIGARLNSFMADLADTANGGFVALPSGVYQTSTPLIVPTQISLWGSGKRTTKIITASGFPINTPLVTLGRVSDGIAFDTALYFMWLDCNLIAGSIGVYSNMANEGCGLYHTIVENARDIGVFYDGGSATCEHFANHDIEILQPNAPSNYCMKIGNGVDNVGPININRATLNGFGPGNTTALIYLHGGATPIFNINFTDLHLEQATDGILIDGDSPRGTINYVDSEGVNNTIRFTGASDIVILNADNFFGTNNILVDAVSGITIPNTQAPLAIWSRKPIIDTSISITTVTAASYTVLDRDTVIVADRAGVVGLTLPDATLNSGRVIRVKNVQSQAVSSNASDVVPLGGGAASTAILPAIGSSWADLKSDGTNWIITAQTKFQYGSLTTLFTSPHVVDATETTIINAYGGGTLILTLPSPLRGEGKILNIVNYESLAIEADASVVVSLANVTGVAILPATAGTWATLQWRGDLWFVIATG